MKTIKEIKNNIQRDLIISLMVGPVLFIVLTILVGYADEIDAFFMGVAKFLHGL